MAYTGIDHFIARLRFRAAIPHVREGSRILDLGCGLEAAFLEYVAGKIAHGVGLDDQVESGKQGRWERVRADIHSPLPFPDARFDHVVMLAVLEHLPNPEPVLREAYRVIGSGGSLIMTWPSSLVDPILYVLHGVRLVSEEMESDEHQKRIPVDKLQGMLQRIGFKKFIHERFEFGLNNLMVATR
jgi:ubiquinone/menaquinone biosynthesis C-methylase UbiE